MSYESPASILYSSDGIEIAVVDATAIPAGTRSILVSGSDGTNSRLITLDTLGRQLVVGAGTAGTAVGGVITIQGVSGGVTVPVSGTISATIANIGTVGSTVPTSAGLIGGTDGTNLRAIFALNTNPAGTEYGLITRNIPSGTQTISGTVTANAGSGNFTVVQSTAANLNAAVVGTGVAGTPAGGVLTIQGVASGTVVPISGNVSFTKSATAISSNVAGSASSVQLLALNTSRSGATVYNDSSAFLYLKLGATASVTSFTVKLYPQSYYEVPFSYTGNIDGIWASATGSARVVELT